MPKGFEYQIFNQNGFFLKRIDNTKKIFLNFQHEANTENKFK